MQKKCGWLHCISGDVQRPIGVISARFDLCSEDGVWIIGTSDASGIWSTFKLSPQNPYPVYICSCIFSLHEDAIPEQEVPQKPWSAFEYIHHLAKEIAWCEEGSREILQCSIPQVKPESILKSYCHEDVVLSFVVNASGSLMMSVSRDGWVKLWDVYSGTLIDSVMNFSMAFLVQLSFAGPAKVVAALSSGDIYLWDVFGFRLELQSTLAIAHDHISSMSCRSILREHESALHACCKQQGRPLGAADASLVAVGTTTGSICLSEKPLHGVSQWNEVDVPQLHHDCVGNVCGICVSPCGAYVSVALDESFDKHRLMIYDLRRRQLLSRHDLPAAPLLMDFFTNGDRLWEERRLEEVSFGVVYASGMPRMTCFCVSSESDGESVRECIPRSALDVFPQKQIRHASVAVGPSHSPSSVDDDSSSTLSVSFGHAWNESGSRASNRPLTDASHPLEALSSLSLHSTQSSCGPEFLEITPKVSAAVISPRITSPVDKSTEMVESQTTDEHIAVAKHSSEETRSAGEHAAERGVSHYTAVSDHGRNQGGPDRRPVEKSPPA